MDRVVSSISIGTRSIGAGSPCFVIAEAGVNHNGSPDLAVKLVDAAAEAGADAVKFQTFRADQLASPNAPKAWYQRDTADSGESQLEMLRRLELPREAYRQLRDHAQRQGIVFLSTPFDEGSAALLDELGVPAFKTSSGDLTNLPLLRFIARAGKPMLVSTGMATLEEVCEAIAAIRSEGLETIALLQCTSAYPADPRDANLRVIDVMRQEFGLPVGYSDHTTGLETAIAAVALGACVIEKHLTVSRSLPGPDHAASLDPGAFARLVADVRLVEAALGDGRKVPSERERETATVARKSLVAARDIAAGEKLTPALVAIQRPGNGLPPRMRDHVLGRAVRIDVARGTVFTLEMLA